MALNIQNVTYSANIGQTNVNLTQTQSGQTQVVVPAGMSSNEAGQALLAHLTTGDKFTGEITNITQNQITISLSDTVSVKATLADALNFNIGDIATFSVKSNNSEQVVLKSEPNEFTGKLINDQTIQNALKNAGVPINEKTASLVHNLMKQGLPINADTINNYAKNLMNVPNATAEDVVLLTRMNIPVTEENVNALHDYYNYNESMDGKAVQMTNAIMNIDFNINPEFLSDFVNSFSETISPMENLNEAVPEKILADISDDLIENNLIKDEEDPEFVSIDNRVAEFASKVKEGSLTAKELINELTNLLKNDVISQESFSKIANSKDFSQIINNFIRQEMFVNPEDVSKQNIKKLFAKIINDTENLAAKFQNNPVANNLLETTNSVKQNVDFLNQANQFMNFVQIPLKMANQNAHGDLYVYKNNRNNLEQKEELKALLHLDMDNLGPMDIYVRLKNANVTTNFKVASDEVLTMIEEHMPELTQRLNKLGFNVQTNVTSEGSNYSFKQSVINEELPAVDIKRFSFDVRA